MKELIRKKDELRLHFLIFEKYTEEELVLTKSKLLTSLGIEFLFLFQKK